MLTAFLLGLTGSFGHCVGMCSGVSLLLSRKANATGWRLLLLHVGRLTTYGLLGALAGGIGFAINVAGGHAGHAHAGQAATGWPALTTIQGVLALVTAFVAAYMALALVGQAPSPEIYLRHWTQGWGRLMRRIPGVERSGNAERGCQPDHGLRVGAAVGTVALWVGLGGAVDGCRCCLTGGGSVDDDRLWTWHLAGGLECEPGGARAGLGFATVTPPAFAGGGGDFGLWSPDGTTRAGGLGFG